MFGERYGFPMSGETGMGSPSVGPMGVGPTGVPWAMGVAIIGVTAGSGVCPRMTAANCGEKSYRRTSGLESGSPANTSKAYRLMEVTAHLGRGEKGPACPADSLREIQGRRDFSESSRCRQ